MSKQLTVHTAEITTAVVEIKTLTITGKQVTLAVFRQLEEAPLIAADGTLNGIPWGRVNYHPDKCSDDGVEHWHIVWQSGTELRRARVNKDRDWPSCIVTDSGNRFLSAVIAERLTGSAEWFNGTSPWVVESKIRGTYIDDYVITDGARWQPFAAALKVSPTGRKAASKARSVREWFDLHEGQAEESFSAWQVKQRDGLTAAAKEALSELQDEVARCNATAEELYDAYLRATQEAHERRLRDTQTRSALVNLPQLFIAV